MDIYEVMETLECALSVGCSQVCTAKHRGECSDAEVQKSLEVATDSIMKQIPKSIAKRTFVNLFSGKTVVTLGCPECGRTVETVWKYCAGCGQRLKHGRA